MEARRPKESASCATGGMKSKSQKNNEYTEKYFFLYEIVTLCS
jgi:hypothetical protein